MPRIGFKNLYAAVMDEATDVDGGVVTYKHLSKSQTLLQEDSHRRQVKLHCILTTHSLTISRTSQVMISR